MLRSSNNQQPEHPGNGAAQGQREVPDFQHLLKPSVAQRPSPGEALQIKSLLRSDAPSDVFRAVRLLEINGFPLKNIEQGSERYHLTLINKAHQESKSLPVTSG